jgi:radical SAM-linked protein
MQGRKRGVNGAISRPDEAFRFGMAKYLLHFEKGELVRWLGHLDILRTMERAVRRAALPIAFSGGFNPREKLSFASALSVGITGANEILLMELTETIPAFSLIERLNAALPPGIRFHHAEELGVNDPREKLNGYDRGEYRVICRIAPHVSQAEIAAAAERFLAQTETIVTREKEGRKKEVNIRPNVYALTDLPEAWNDEGQCGVDMIVGQGESGTARPAEVIAVLATELEGLSLRRAQRVRLLHRESP